MARKDGEADLRESARKLTQAAVDTLSAVMRDGKSEHARVAAAAAILDRGWGKPGQAVKVGGDAAAGPIEHVIRWAVTPAEAAADPSASFPRDSA